MDGAALPKGVTFDHSDQGFRIAVSTRSYIALFTVPFTVIWILGALGGISTELAKDAGNSSQVLLFASIFGLTSAVLIAITAMTVFGRVIVTADGYDGTLFVGLTKSLGWTRRFSWGDIDRVEEGESLFKPTGGKATPLIVLDGKTTIKFGMWLKPAQRVFVLQTLRELLASRR